jgi:MtN3 and saliva related transmembrane protein
LLFARRHKRVDVISLTKLLFFSFGTACRLVDMLGIGSWPVTVAKAVTVAPALAILVLKLKYDAEQ